MNEGDVYEIKDAETSVCERVFLILKMSEYLQYVLKVTFKLHFTTHRKRQYWAQTESGGNHILLGRA